MLPGAEPADTVRAALDRIAAHDLAGATVLVCADRRNPRDLPFTIGGIFAPVGALPGFDVPRTLSVIELDVSGLRVSERTRDGDLAEVDVEGILVERFDPAAVEALFRAYAAEGEQPVDQALLAETIAAVSRGPVALPVRETVTLIREGGSWKVCPPIATP